MMSYLSILELRKEGTHKYTRGNEETHYTANRKYNG